MPPARPLVLATCQVPGVAGDARCGTYEVLENRAAADGRRIGLNIVVLPAVGPDTEADPVFILQGGPGQAATGLAEFYADMLAPVRRTRDIVLVDQRGTGGSNSLACDLPGNEENLQAYLGDLFPVEAIRACRLALERRADLTRYTTPIAMEDLDEVRAALGYERINIYGTSYGTRAALVYMRHHPERVRSVVLKAVAPMSMVIGLHYARDAQRAMNLLFDDCAADAQCRVAFPSLRQEFEAVLERLAKGPARATVPHPTTGRPVAVSLPRDAFTVALRNQLLSPTGASRVPLLIHRAFRGDFGPVAEMTLGYRRAFADGGVLAHGMFLSIICAEDMPRIDRGAAERAAAGTFLGDSWLTQVMRACEAWPRGEVPHGYDQPVHSNLPVLLISGYLDPAISPEWGEEALRTLPNGRHVVIRNGSHSFDQLRPCVDAIIAEFMARGSVQGIDTSCVDQIRRPPWVLTDSTSRSRSAPGQ